MKYELPPKAGRAVGTDALSLEQIYALLLLMTVYTCHAIDRNIVSIVLEPIKRELHVSDRLMGAIPLAFSLAFIAAVLPIGVLIDKTNRVRLLAFLLAVWSLTTSLAGAASVFPLLVAARVGVGVAEAGGQPLALSLLSDLFPQGRRASALGVFYLSTGIGSIIAFLCGGAIAAAYGWRMTFLLGGVPGFVLAPVLLATLREPRRGAMDVRAERAPSERPASVREAFRIAVSCPPLVCVLLGMFSSSVVLGSFLVWSSGFLMREHDLTIKAAGAGVALAGGVMPAVGAVLSGFCADALGRSHPARGGWVCGVSAAVMAASGILFTLAPTPTLAVACLIGFGLFGGGWMAPALAMLIGLTPPRSRGAVLAFGQMFTALGSGLGPFMVGWLSDLLHRLGPALACSAIVSLVGMTLYGLAVAMAEGQGVTRERNVA